MPRRQHNGDQHRDATAGLNAGLFALRALVVALAFALLNWLAGRYQAFPGVSMIYPASAVGVVAGFLWRWPAAVGVFVATVATPWGAHSPAWAMACYGLGNSIEAILPAVVLSRGRPTSDSRAIARVFAWAVLANTWLNVLIGRGVRVALGDKALDAEAIRGALAWWAADALAIAALALPVLLYLRPRLFFTEPEALRWRPVSRIEIQAPVVTAVLAVSIVVYLHDTLFSHSFNWPVLLYLVPLSIGLLHGLPTVTVTHALVTVAYFATLAAEVRSAVSDPLRSAEILVVVYGNLLVFTLFVWIAGSIRSKNLWLVDRLDRRWRSLRETFGATVKALAVAMEAKDLETERHLDRVSRHAVAIGRRLGLGERQLDLLRWGAILHDIGKIGVPGSILQKPGPLTPDEHEQMERHLDLGAEILDKTGVLDEVVPYVRYHEERWDGATDGRHPARFGLVGEEIPLGARIITVADAWDAMTSDRPYRAALDLEAAVTELRTEAGRQFDPHIVKVFLELLVENGVLEVSSRMPTLRAGPEPVGG